MDQYELIRTAHRVYGKSIRETSRSYIATSGDFKGASRSLRGPVESVAESGTPFGLALTAFPLSVSKNPRRQFPHTRTTTYSTGWVSIA